MSDETLEYEVEMSTMRIFIDGIDQYVIEVYDNEIIEPLIKQGIHCGLKCRGCIGKTERHDQEFICTITGGESSFVFVAGFDCNLMVSRVEVKFCEVFGFAEAIMEVVYSG